MPELPEVETIKRQLTEVLVGQEIVAVEVKNKKSFIGDAKKIVGEKIAGVNRRAKILVIELNDLFLLVHLKMTGQLVYDGRGKRVVGGHPTVDWIAQLPNNHTRVILHLSKGTLFFNDQRIFGWMKYTRDLEKEFKNYGPDITDRKVTKEYFYSILQKSRRAVKLVITDQKDVAGVGNIYANDGLWCAKISPMRKANSLMRKESDKLLTCLREVIDEGIKYGGATASDDKFVQTSGLGGKYQEHFKVYERAGEKCLRCKSIIQKVTLGGRGTYFCPECQKKVKEIMIKRNWLDKMCIFQKVILLRSDGRILTIIRREDDIRRPGAWDFPGGGLEKGEDVIQSLTREIKEEVGLNAADFTPVFVSSEIGWHQPGVDVVAIAYVGKVVFGEVRLSEEHVEFKWVNPAEFMKLDTGDDGGFLKKALRAWENRCGD